MTSILIGIKLLIFLDKSSFCNSNNRSRRRATATVVIPDSANFIDMALPIPDEAPVTKAIFFINDGITVPGIEERFENYEIISKILYLFPSHVLPVGVSGFGIIFVGGAIMYPPSIKFLKYFSNVTSLRSGYSVPFLDKNSVTLSCLNVGAFVK